MSKATMHEIRSVQCPEGKGRSTLLLQWDLERTQEVLMGICCNNVHLLDLSGADCGWSCWEWVAVHGFQTRAGLPPQAF